MAAGKTGNSYGIGAGLPFAAPKKTNTKAMDTFNKKKEEPILDIPKSVAVEEAEKETSPVTEIKSNVMVNDESTFVKASQTLEKRKSLSNYKASSKKLNQYSGDRRSSSYSFCDENDLTFVKIKANRLGMSYQDFLAEIILADIETIKADKFDYKDPLYKDLIRGVKNPVTDRFALRTDFIDDIKSAAAIIGLKRASFVAYSVHKARLADPNPAWD